MTTHINERTWESNSLFQVNYSALLHVWAALGNTSSELKTSKRKKCAEATEGKMEKRNFTKITLKHEKKNPTNKFSGRLAEAEHCHIIMII